MVPVKILFWKKFGKIILLYIAEDSFVIQSSKFQIIFFVKKGKGMLCKNVCGCTLNRNALGESWPCENTHQLKAVRAAKIKKNSNLEKFVSIPRET